MNTLGDIFDVLYPMLGTIIEQNSDVLLEQKGKRRRPGRQQRQKRESSSQEGLGAYIFFSVQRRVASARSFNMLQSMLQLVLID